MSAIEVAAARPRIGSRAIRIAIVGCGYVADYYLATLAHFPELRLAGVHDRDPARAQRIAHDYGVPCYDSLEGVLADDELDIVVNLTSLESHFEVSRAALEAGKHVYSEKPLALRTEDAQELVGLARMHGLFLSAAPCTILNEAAQTAWKALRDGRIGRVRLVYAEMDDGAVHQMPYHKWRSASGRQWPYHEEFAAGCILEHAGYVLSLLAGFFGPARGLNAFSTCLIGDKGNSRESLPVAAADFSVACIPFASGVVARVTCGSVAPRNHALRIFGDEGVLSIDDISHDRSSVSIRRYLNLPKSRRLSPWKQRCRLVGQSNARIKRQGSQARNFARGIADLAAAIQDGRSPRLSSEFCLHVHELTMAMQRALVLGETIACNSTFAALDPMPWAV